MDLDGIFPSCCSLPNFLSLTQNIFHLTGHSTFLPEGLYRILLFKCLFVSAKLFWRSTPFVVES